MPEIYPLPTALPASDAGTSLLSAAIAALQADPETGTSGTLGVAQIVRRYAQPSGQPWQDFTKAKRPAIVLWVTRGSQRMVGAMLRSTAWTLHVGCVADDAAQHSGEDLVLRMQSRALDILATKRGSAAFVSGYQLDMEPESETVGEPALADENGSLWMSESTIDLALLWAEAETAEV